MVVCIGALATYACDMLAMQERYAGVGGRAAGRRGSPRCPASTIIAVWLTALTAVPVLIVSAGGVLRCARTRLTPAAATR